MSRVRAHDLGVICWHEERESVIRELYRIGVDGVCTDRPDLLWQAAESNPAQA